MVPRNRDGGPLSENFLEGTEEEWLDMRPGDMEIVKAPLDFIGINLYTRMTIAHDPHDTMMGTRPAYHGEENELTDFGWEVYPQALSQHDHAHLA